MRTATTRSAPAARPSSCSKGRHRFRWDGRLTGGAVAPDGEYRLRVGLRRQGRTITSPRKLFVDTKPPRPIVRYVSPAAISPDGAGTGNRATLRFDGPFAASPHAARLPHRSAGRRDLVARRPGRLGSQVSSPGTGESASGAAAAARRAATTCCRPDARRRRQRGPSPPADRRSASGPSRRASSATSSARARSARCEPAAGAVSPSKRRRRYRWSVRRLGSQRVA